MLGKCPLFKKLNKEEQKIIKKLVDFLVNNGFSREQSRAQIKLLYTSSKNLDQVKRLMYGYYTEILFENFCLENGISHKWNNGSNSTSIYTGYYLDENDYLREKDSNDLREKIMLSADFKIKSKNGIYLIDIKYTNSKTSFFKLDKGECFPRLSCPYLKKSDLERYYNECQKNNYIGAWIQLNVINNEEPFNIIKTVFIDVEEALNELMDLQSIRITSHITKKRLELVIFNLKEWYSSEEFLQIINSEEF